MINSKAFVFDMNGTMIDDMAFHQEAWSAILNSQLDAGLTDAEVKVQMYGRNDEVLDRIFGPDRFTREEKDRLSIDKEVLYQQQYLPHMRLIDGLDVFLKAAKAHGVPMAIGTAAIPFNVDFVLDRLDLRGYFPVVVHALDVVASKPHPETFLKAAQLLGVPAENCIVFEDAPKGVEAARNAGMQAVVLTTMHEAHEFGAYDNILAFVKDYTDPYLQTLL